MDRDIAMSLVEKLGVLNTALTELSANTSPSNPNRGENRMLLSEDVPEEPEVIPEEEPVTRNKK